MQAPASGLPTAQGLSAGQALKPGPASGALSRPLMRSLPNSQPPSRLSTPTLPASLIGGLQPTLTADSAQQVAAVAVQSGLQQPQAPIGSATAVTGVAGAVSIQQPPARLAAGTQPDAAVGQQPSASHVSASQPDTAPVPDQGNAIPSGEVPGGVKQAEALGPSEPSGEGVTKGTTDGLEPHEVQASAMSDAVGSAQDDAPAVFAPVSQLANGDLKVPVGAWSDKLPAPSAEVPAAESLDRADKLPAASAESPSASILQGVPEIVNAPVAADDHDKDSEKPVRSIEAAAAAVNEPAEMIKPADALPGDLAPSHGASIVPVDVASALPDSSSVSQGGDMGLTVIGRATANAASAAAVATSVALSEDILMADGFLAIDPPSPPKPGLEASHALTENAAQATAEKTEADIQAGEDMLPAHDGAPLATIDTLAPAAASVAAAAPGFLPAEPLPSSSALQLQAQPLQLSQSPITQPVLQNVQPLQPTPASLGPSSAAHTSITAQPALQPLQPLQPFTVPGRPSSAGGGLLQAGMGRGSALQKGPSLLGLLRGIAPQTTANPVPGTPLLAMGTPRPQVGTGLTSH